MYLLYRCNVPTKAPVGLPILTLLLLKPLVDLMIFETNSELSEAVESVQYKLEVRLSEARSYTDFCGVLCLQLILTTLHLIHAVSITTWSLTSSSLSDIMIACAMTIFVSNHKMYNTNAMSSEVVCGCRSCPLAILEQRAAPSQCHFYITSHHQLQPRTIESFVSTIRIWQPVICGL